MLRLKIGNAKKQGLTALVVPSRKSIGKNVFATFWYILQHASSKEEYVCIYKELQLIRGQLQMILGEVFQISQVHWCVLFQ